MLTATPEIDTSLAQQQWDEFVQHAGESLGKLAPMGDKAGDALKGLTDEAKKTAKAVEAINFAQKMEKAVGQIGNVKDIVEKSGKALWGMSDAAIGAVSKVGELAEKGASLGAAFGPIGATVGAVLGGLLGAYTAWAEATEKARQEQEKLARETVSRSFVAMAKQREAVEATTKTWEEYGLAVRRAGGVQISTIEGILSTVESSTSTEVDAIQKRVDAWAEAVENIKATTKGRIRTEQEVADLIKYEQGLTKTQIELWHAQNNALKDFSGKIAPDLARAFDTSDKATKAFNEELAKIGKEPTVKQLETDLANAKTELGNAETKVKDLKTQLSAGPKEGEGFFEYMDRLKLLLIDSQNAANELANAQGKVLGAAGAVTDKKTSGPKQKSFAELAKEQQDDQDQASADFFRSQREAAEDAAATGLEDLLRAEEDRQLVLDTRAVEALNKEEERLKNLQALRDQYQVDAVAKQLEVGEKLKEEEAKQAEAQAEFYNTIIQGAVDAAASVANALAGQAVQAFDKYLDAVANGEKRTKESNKRQRVEFLRKTGTMLITDGTGHVVAGTVKGIAGDPAGFAEAIAGAGEIAVGVGMGGIGARGQRALGGTQARVDERAQSGSSVGGSPSGTQTLNPIVINFQSVVPHSEREQQEIGNKIKSFVNASDRSRN